MYEKHFNLHERPFRNVPDTRMFFSGGGRGDVLRELRFAIESGEGIIKVVGEVGSGKTMLCRMLDESLPENIQVVFLSNPSLEPEYILHAVAQELGLPVTLSTNRYTAQQELQKYLLKQHENGKQVVVLIEEAQCMPPRTLEEIRLMSNLETEKQKLLQLVLFGQPELDDLLSRSDLRQFNERISYAFFLASFSLESHREYLNHRLLIAGYHGPELFNSTVVKHIYKFANGSVRRINLLADKTLLAAYAYNDRTIQIKHARSAAEDSKYIARVDTGLSIKYLVPLGLLSTFALVYLFNSYIINEASNVSENNASMNELNYKNINEKNVDVNKEVLLSTTELKPIVMEPILTLPSELINLENENKENSKLNTRQSSNSKTNNKSLSEIRVEKTMQWLKTADRTQYTIQLMTGFVDEAAELYDLEDILKRESDPNEIEKYLVFRGTANGIPVFVICYRTFSSLVPARRAIKGLPDILKRYRPFVRNLSSIMREIGGTDA